MNSKEKHLWLIWVEFVYWYPLQYPLEEYVCFAAMYKYSLLNSDINTRQYHSLIFQEYPQVLSPDM